MRNGLRNRKAARLAVLVAALGMFIGGVTATASAADETEWNCFRGPTGWFCA